MISSALAFNNPFAAIKLKTTFVIYFNKQGYYLADDVN